MSELKVDDEALALDEIKAIGPGGSHLARPYTRSHFRQIWQSEPARHDAARRLAGGRREDAAGPPQGAGRGAALRAARLRKLSDDVKAGLDRILAEVEAQRPGS